jgi:hypothetical protein
MATEDVCSVPIFSNKFVASAGCCNGIDTPGDSVSTSTGFFSGFAVTFLFLGGLERIIAQDERRDKQQHNNDNPTHHCHIGK